ncbi:hypothetical protein MASR2M48_30170 [Spirochaetota bacterium]
MPEIAAMGALERLDMMLNDSMYGILFRDINMYRTFVDQKFSRMMDACAGIIINTGEDNYLTTSDAYEKAYTVLASQFLNERFAFHAGLERQVPWGWGTPSRWILPSRTASYTSLHRPRWPARSFRSTRSSTCRPPSSCPATFSRVGEMDTLFNFVSKATNQGIHLLGMLTEAIHTPFMMDRFLAVDNARYVMNNMDGFYEDIEFKKDGIVVSEGLSGAQESIRVSWSRSRKPGSSTPWTQGLFAEVKRPKDGGKGFEGLVKKGPRLLQSLRVRPQARLRLSRIIGGRS